MCPNTLLISLIKENEYCFNMKFEIVNLYKPLWITLLEDICLEHFGQLF